MTGETITFRVDDACPADWNGTISGLPGASILQTAEWGALKGAHGWTPRWLRWIGADGRVAAAALVLRKKIAGPFEFRYVPRGPLVEAADWALCERVFTDLTADARADGAIFLKTDRDVPIGYGVPGSETYREDADGAAWLSLLKRRGFRYSETQVQFANSVWIDLTSDEETLLANMKQRARYKARLALKKGVSVRRGAESEFEEFYELYRVTARRDGFIIREKAYYLDVWTRFYRAGMMIPLVAGVGNETVAVVLLFLFAGKAWYVYGMSSGTHREKMPNYALQWEAIRTAKAEGARVYDLWGAPDVFGEGDRMWGVYQFKRGLGGYEVLSPGAYDLPLRPFLYRAYAAGLRLLTGARRFLYRVRERGGESDGGEA